MSDIENDEDFKRAIALSLMSPNPDSQPPLNVLSSDEDEDNDLDRPLTARSITSARANADKRPSPSMEEAHEIVIERSSSEDRASSMTLGLLGLNRKQMEGERLARAATRKIADEDVSISAARSRKRKASISPATSRDRDRLTKEGSGNVPKSPITMETKRESESSKDATSAEPKKRMLNLLQTKNKTCETWNTQPDEHGISLPISSHTTSDTNAKAPRQLSVTEHLRSFDHSGIQYPDGIVKKTWVFGCDRQGDDIKIEEVFQKNDLEIAVLSAFQLDADWVMSKLNSKTKVIWVLQAKDEAQRQNWASGAPKNFRFCFPPMEGDVNCMHSKLQILAHPTHLRIAVPSANLTPYDWGETGVMENVCFLIDLPRLPQGQEMQLEHVTQFGKELLNFCRAMGLGKSQIDSMRRFDFSNTANLAFVHSIGGSHAGTQMSSTGFCGLGKAVRALRLNTEGALDIEFLAASIGNLNENFVKSMYLAAKGDDGLTEYGWRTDKSTKGKGLASDQERKVCNELKSRCRIYFPSRKTVEQSKGGTDAGGTICFQPNWYAAKSFPRSLMRDCRSQRRGILMHSKMIFVRLEKADLQGSMAWAYVGSANLSENACRIRQSLCLFQYVKPLKLGLIKMNIFTRWVYIPLEALNTVFAKTFMGRLVRDNASKEIKVTLRSWECGVLIPVPRAMAPAGEAADRGAEIWDRLDMSVFDGHIPVPMIVPGEQYRDRRPWFYSEQ